MTESTTSAAVVVVGSANVDLVASSPRMPKPGETISGTRFEQLFGGKGSNQAVAAALLGSSVRMVAKVGTDSLGESYLDNFRQMGVDTAHVGQTPEAATGVAQITVDDAGRECDHRAGRRVALGRRRGGGRRPTARVCCSRSSRCPCRRRSPRCAPAAPPAF